MADYFEFAADYKFNGFEMHGVSEMDDADVKSVYHKLYDYKIKISCIDMASDISTDGEKAFAELTKCISGLVFNYSIAKTLCALVALVWVANRLPVKCPEFTRFVVTDKYKFCTLKN